jgi:alkylation response protein AidB-like acyl-CoA dehydrogenase
MRFEPVVLTTEQMELREDVRAFIADELARGTWERGLAFDGFAPEFSRRLAAKGWIGMALPSRYGGHDRKAVDRFIVVEELLAAGAPVNAHWIADRQSGPTILAFGTEEQRVEFLPPIARGELCFCIGMSEPDAGSDLAAVRTSATPVPGGWAVSGTKVWTSGAHQADFMLALVRTEPLGDDRHVGLSQLVIDLRAPGVSISPIHTLDGRHHFNEVAFVDVFVPDGRVLGEVGRGWHQVTSELAFERSGPDRYLSTYPLLHECLDSRRDIFADPRGRQVLGELAARYWTVRQLSLSVARALDEKRSVAVEAALVKDIGTQLDQHLARVVLRLLDSEPEAGARDRLSRLLAHHALMAASHTLRGGTTEVLRTIVARSFRERASV